MKIGLFVAIVAVDQSYACLAMTTARSYREARSTADAVAELRRCWGTQFDPAVVDTLVEIVAESEEAQPIPLRPVAEAAPLLPQTGSAVAGQS